MGESKNKGRKERRKKKPGRRRKQKEERKRQEKKSVDKIALTDEEVVGRTTR